MNRRGDALLVALALPLLLVAAYFILYRTSEKAEIGPHHTSHSSLPTGYRAAFLLLQQRGIAVERYQASVQRWPDDARVMISAKPIKGVFSAQIWNKEETEDAIRWIENGGALILLSDEDNELSQKLFLLPNEIGTKDASLPPRQIAPFLHGVKKVFFPGEWRFAKVPDTAVSLFSDKQAAFLVFRRGKGLAFSAPTAAIFDNHHIGKADNARLFVQLIESQLTGAEGKRRRVYFDELHQGFQTDPSFWDVIGAPGRFIFLQLTLSFALLCYSVGRRFGLPRPAPTPARVSSEYVASLADLYRRAGARDVALEGVYLAFWRDLCRAAGLPLDAEVGEVAARAAILTEGDSGKMRGRLQEILERSETAIAGGAKKLSEIELLRWTREMDALRKELGLSGNE